MVIFTAPAVIIKIVVSGRIGFVHFRRRVSQEDGLREMKPNILIVLGFAVLSPTYGIAFKAPSGVSEVESTFTPYEDISFFKIGSVEII